MALGDMIGKTINELQGLIAREVTGVGGKPGRALSVYVENAFGAGGGAGGGVLPVTGSPSAFAQKPAVLSVGGAYSAGDYVGTSAALMAFPLARQGGGSILLTSALLIDEALQSVACELWIYKTDVVPPTDNAAWTIQKQSQPNIVAILPCSTYYAGAASSICVPYFQPFLITCAPGDVNLYAGIVTRGAPTYPIGNGASQGGLVVSLNALQLT